MADACQYCSPDVPCVREPFASHNNVFGPSIEEIVLALLFLVSIKSCEVYGIFHKPLTKGFPECFKENYVSSWLSEELTSLAEELFRLGYDINDPGGCPPTPSMVLARKFVFNKLAELMEKKDELESNFRKRSENKGNCPCVKK